ncbi:hypothetical protein V6667_05085 [Neisseria leonii]|uniref:Uncharacterized protein n=1 Tax=Neisseria leonii TaxID=2995413 RepID=A0A9X4ID32_9NEIS|nr:hypothetical protein [Neisseria sp. 51.81]MDD9326772.1 hypothetical protein [Neisseria sp. 51.81]
MMKWNSIGVPNVPKMPQHIGNALIGFGGAQLIGRVFGEKWGIFNQRGIRCCRSTICRTNRRLLYTVLQAELF